MALNGKVAIVTGAAQGLGKGFSDILLKNGAKVALFDVDEVLGKQTKTEFDKAYGADRTLFVKADVTSDDQIKDAFKKTLQQFGGIDIVCNNAGIVDENNWEKAVSVNLNGVVRGSYLALNYMKKENGGRGGVIVNVASMAGLGPMLTAPVYTATKHGVVGFSRAMAEFSEVVGYGVRFNALCPHFVQTSLLSFLQSEERTGQFANVMGLTKSAMKQLGTLDVADVAKGFLLLVTDETKNGAILMVNQEGAAFKIFPKLVQDESFVTVTL